MATGVSSLDEEIDNLLQLYLLLLDEYTRLRDALNALQASIFQNLARANFSAERGIRYYGQDYYDDRAQAVRMLTVGRSSLSGSATFEFAADGGSSPVRGQEDADASKDKIDVKMDQKEEKGKGKEEEAESPRQGPSPKDPLRWFGILTPMPLREAQKQAVRAAEHLIPRLATVSAEMAAVELEVRRARKKRAKADAATEKLKQHQVSAADDTEHKGLTA